MLTQGSKLLPSVQILFETVGNCITEDGFKKTYFLETETLTLLSYPS